MMIRLSLLLPLLWVSVTHFAFAQALPQQKLIIVQDKGGTTALPYYEALGLVAEPFLIERPQPTDKPSIIKPITDTDMLPVESKAITPGSVTARTIQAPRLTPIFLIGDDEFSKRWLKDRKAKLNQLQAIGLIVNVKTPQGLQNLRALAPELQMYPISGDDIAVRLGLTHYPVLITSTAIEQ